MQDKYSLAKCEHYGRRLAARLCQLHFGPRPEATLDGPALLRFTPVRQLNLLVLRQLLGRWQQEAQQLRSPYFDFGAAPVRAALTQFMNVLSRHLCLDRAALEPLLAQAAADALLLAADPARAFERLLLPTAGPEADEPVSLAQLRDGLRYIDQDQAYYQGFVASLPTGPTPLGRDFLTQRFALYHNQHPQSAEAMPRLVAAFSALLPLTEADLRGEGPAPAPAPTPPAVAKPTPVSTEPALAAAATSRGSAAPGPTLPDTTLAGTVPTPPVPAKAAVADPGPLDAKLPATSPAASPPAGARRPGGPAPLAERNAPPAASLREAISINQRFSFINELFNGENAAYYAAIEHLDTLPTAAAALAYVRQELAPAHDWSRKEEHVGRLLKLLERKFAAA